MSTGPSQSHRRRWIAFGAALALAFVAICLLMTEHRTHVPRLIVYLVIPACPLMHLLGHHRHHRHHDR